MERVAEDMKTAEQHNLPILGTVDIIKPAEPARSGGARISSGTDSKQDYQTPWEFIHAVESKFGEIGFDLAADAANSKAGRGPIGPLNFYSELDNSLIQPWHTLSGNLWLNPPFKRVSPWAHKCAEEASLGAKILLLTPAAVDTNWWRDFVHEKARVLFLSPRIQFDGAGDPFMKPLSLACYNFSLPKWYEPWRWRL